MDVFIKADPQETSFAAIKSVALTERPGFRSVTDADVKATGEALAIFVFASRVAAIGFAKTMRTLAHEYVSGNWDEPYIDGHAYILCLVDCSMDLLGEAAREPGLHYHDFRY